MLMSRLTSKPHLALSFTTTTIRRRTMASIVHDSIPHEDRTASEPRQNRVEPVTITNIRQINPTTRVLRLSPQDPNHTIKVRPFPSPPTHPHPTIHQTTQQNKPNTHPQFLPGQWLDTFIPGIPKAGGFTITSAPSTAAPSKNPPSPGHIELAIQKSSNPPAQYFHLPQESILNKPLLIRVGGSFTYPPPTLPIPTTSINRLVLIAGGVGINPLISIFSHLVRLHASQRPEEIHFLYGTKAEDSEADPQSILFLPRLMDLVGAVDEPKDVTLSLFLTGNTGYEGGERIEHGKLPNRTWARRLGEGDLVGALDGWRGESEGGKGREGTVCYVCGPQKMTDEVVEFLGRQEGMAPGRVLCEKWW